MMTSGSGEGWFLETDERRIDLREGEVTLGRSRGCGVVLRDPSVSRGHALLSMRQGRVTLQDLRSSNGTYVNGKRLEKETTLEAGDRLVIGETELFLHRAGESQGSTGRRVETGEAILFCVACGLPIHGPSGGRCPGCGAELAAGPRPEEVPAASAPAASGSLARPVFGAGGRGSREVSAQPARQERTPTPTPVPAPADPGSTAETRPRDASGGVAPPPAPLSEVPMSVREAEGRAPVAPEPAVTPFFRTPTPPPPAPPGLWSRLTRLLRGE